MEFSLRYPPVRGRLHTRYAPVRRSSPEYCYPALPLDLHVLSLPLAFILSQDQTLHCKNCFVLPFDSSSCRTHIYICMPTHAISFFSSVSNNTRFFSTAVFSAKADAKIQPFSNMPKYFFRKMRFGVPILLSYSVVHRQKNFRCVRFPAPQNGAARGKKGGKSIPGGRNRPSEGQKRDISL